MFQKADERPGEVQSGRPMRKPLRIAISTVSLLICASLIALWLRSFFSCDEISGGYPGRVYFIGASLRGRLLVALYDEKGAIFDASWRIKSLPASDHPSFPDLPAWFHVAVLHRPLRIGVPQWIPVLLSGIITALPWVKRHVGLRIMLIAVTLVVLVLGLSLLSR